MIHWLIGPSGAGKSTIGTELASRRSAWFVDLDKKIEAESGMSIPDLFAEYGEAGFRAREREILRGVVAEHRRKRLVVATGGGTVVDPRNRDLMRSTGLRILLEVDAGVALERLERSDARPLLAGDDRLSAWKNLLESRKEAYADHDVAVRSTGTPQDVTDAILASLRKFHTSLWRINAHLADQKSRLWALRSPYSTIRAVRRLTRFNRRCVITDTNLQRLYERTLQRLAGNDGLVIAVQPGEESKSFDVAEQIIAQLLEAGFSRSDCIIGFGGGVVTDLAGFIASIYMRGLRCISVPTSLLGMVDAAVGGKTAINAAGMRNLVGTFRQPTDILICDAFLRTLPARELRSGTVEALKMGMILWGDLYNRVVEGTPDILAGRIPSDIAEIVRASVTAKLKIIGNDVQDEKDRAMLNLGHTFGHALEAAYPGTFTHGEAVAFGIVAAVELGAQILTGIRKESFLPLGDAALPYTFVPEFDLDFGEILRKMGGDKKKQKGRLRFVIPLGDQRSLQSTLPVGAKSLMVGVPANEADVLAAMERAWGRILAYHREQHHRRNSQ